MDKRRKKRRERRKGRVQYAILLSTHQSRTRCSADKRKAKELRKKTGGKFEEREVVLSTSEQ